VDEAGVDNKLYRPYGRSPRGVKIYASLPGKKRERISMIGGWVNHTFIAPMSFQGGCNRIVFNAWIKNILLPELAPGMTVVMDNAAFHKSPQTRSLIEKAGCFLKFLPAYSPDLNPIEHCWHKLKSLLKPLIQKSTQTIQNLVDQCLIKIINAK
jgi:transposase